MYALKLVVSWLLLFLSIINFVVSFQNKNGNGYNADLIVQTVAQNAIIDAQNGLSPSSKKSPSFLSNRSENMSLDGRNSAPMANSNSMQNMSPLQHTFTVASYEDHWAYEKIVLERVRENLA